jgi:hypothetical protein
MGQAIGNEARYALGQFMQGRVPVDGTPVKNKQY